MESDITAYYSQGSEENVMLATALVNISDSKENLQTCRVFLNSGSQFNFITKQYYDRLNLTIHKSDMTFECINEMTISISHKSQITLQSMHGRHKRTSNCLVTVRVTGR